MKKLAIVGAQRMAKNYAINAREMGVETHCFAWPKGAVAKDCVDHFYPISIFEVEQIISVCRSIGIDGVVSTSELTIPVAAQVAAKLGLNGIDVETAKVITNKFRNRVASAGVDGLEQPKYACVGSVADVVAAGLEYPLVLKPVAEGGKRGVSVVNSSDELDRAFIYAGDESKDGEAVIAEEFISGGREFSVESLSYHNRHEVIQVTEKISSGPPHCVELGHVQPARISETLRAKIKAVIPYALDAIGYANGPSHTEIKIVGEKIYLIEFNVRPGGDFISYPLIDLSSGYHYLQAAIGIALDDFKFNQAKLSKDCNFAGVVFITEQTRSILPIFNSCDSASWLYRKNVAGNLKMLTHNDCDASNYIIWRSVGSVPKELEDVYNRQ